MKYLKKKKKKKKRDILSENVYALRTYFKVWRLSSQSRPNARGMFPPTKILVDMWISTVLALSIKKKSKPMGNFIGKLE